jgi:hypothetical protein
MKPILKAKGLHTPMAVVSAEAWDLITACYMPDAPWPMGMMIADVEWLHNLEKAGGPKVPGYRRLADRWSNSQRQARKAIAAYRAKLAQK